MISQQLSLPCSPSLLLRSLEKEAKRRRDTNRLRHYAPYSKQREFHAAGKAASERLFMAGNQLGKTIAGGAEWAMHLTGRYPDWWDGAVFEKPVTFWAAGVTGDSTRDNPQRILIGPPAMEHAWGRGMIPADALGEITRGRFAANAIDTAIVKFGGGGDVQAGDSQIGFKTYEQGREKWQGPTLDGVWFDEEPPSDVYAEGLTRTNRGQRSQFTMITFTPLKGMSDVVSLFLLAESK